MQDHLTMTPNGSVKPTVMMVKYITVVDALVGRRLSSYFAHRRFGLACYVRSETRTRIPDHEFSALANGSIRVCRTVYHAVILPNNRTESAPCVLRSSKFTPNRRYFFIESVNHNTVSSVWSVWLSFLSAKTS